MVKKGNLKEAAAPTKPGVAGIGNTTKAVPNTITTQQAVPPQQAVVAGLKKINLSDTQTATPQPLNIGAAQERTNTEIPAAGGAAGRVVAIGQTASAKPSRIG